MSARGRERAVGFALLLLATAIEAVAVYLWLRWHHHGHTWRADASLVVGETLETGLFRFALDRRPRARWGPLDPSTPGFSHGARMQRTTTMAGVAEIGIWLLWLLVAEKIGQGIAAGVLLVLMHVKHHVESAAVRDLPFRAGLWSLRNIFASATEAAGAVACLALIRDGRPLWGLAAIGGGILIEHAAQLDALHWEMQARDIRLPRDRRFRPAARSRPIELYVITHGAWLWKLLQRIKPFEWRVNAFMINHLIAVVEPRPNRLSTMSPYTSWASLSDRHWASRHLPPTPAGAGRPATELAGPPPSADVAELFRRAGDTIQSGKSTVLFTLFAQWFTDGFLRTKRVANEGQLRDARLSESTNEIDLSQLYGLSCEQTIQLRTMVGGRLKSQVIDGEEYPEYYCHAGLPKAQFDRLLPRVGFDGIGLAERDRLFAMASDVTNLSVVAFNTLFLREHNRIADHLSAAQPSWNDEQLFETARNTLVVVLLKLVVEEYINHITPNHFQFRLLPGRFDRQPWYRSNWMAIEFNLLYRWHSLVPSTFLLDGRPLTIEETLWDTKVVTQAGLGRVMAAASTQAAGRIGLFNTHEFLVERADLTSIKQARVARLASYNDYRRLCGLPPAANFADINPSDPAVRAALAARYATAEDVEFYPGLFAEPLVPNCVLPELMLTMVAFDAFSQALTNPLLSPQVFNKQTFSATGLKIIRTTNSLSEIVHRNLPAGSPQYPVTFTRPDFVRE